MFSGSMPAIGAAITSRLVPRYILTGMCSDEKGSCIVGVSLSRVVASAGDVQDERQPAAALLLAVVVLGVVVDVAVQQPLPRLTRLPDHVVALAGADVDRVLRPLGGLRHRVAVHCHDAER